MRSLLLLTFSAGLSFAQIQGLVDIHVHSDPDSVPRKLDALDTARQAKAAGVRAIVLKNHWAPTVQLPYTGPKGVPRMELFWPLSPDPPEGSGNPEAVSQCA